MDQETRSRLLAEVRKDLKGEESFLDREVPEGELLAVNFDHSKLVKENDQDQVRREHIFGYLCILAHYGYILYDEEKGTFETLEMKAENKS